MKKYCTLPTVVSVGILLVLAILLAFASTETVLNTLLSGLVLTFAAAFTGLYLMHRATIVHAMAQWDEELLVRQLEGIGFIHKVVSANPASIAAGAVGTATAAVAGLTPAHRVFASGQAAFSAAVHITGARCAAAGTVTIDFANASAGALDLAAVNVAILAIPGDLN